MLGWKKSLVRVIVVVKHHEQPVEIGSALAKTASKFFLGPSCRACLLAHPSNMTQHVPRLPLDRHHHMHPEKSVLFDMQVAREEGGSHEILDLWVMFGEQGGKVHLLPAVGLLEGGARVGEGVEVAAPQEIDGAV